LSSNGSRTIALETPAPSHRPRRLAFPLPLPGSAAQGDAAWPFGAAAGRSLYRRLRMLRRLTLVLLWTAISIPPQAFFLVLPGRPKVVFARIYWAVFARMLGVRVRVIGTMEKPRDGRPVVFVSNHSSWVDIAVLGGQLEGCFVAKEEVARWPVIRTIARLGRSVFVTRQRAATSRERDAMQQRLAQGDGLILFPEGTTSDGARVLPFRSAFFAVATGENPPMLQPVSIVYDRLGGLPTGRANRPAFSWYGDMDIASHYVKFGQQRGMRATVVLHAPVDPRDFPERKALAQAVWQVVADGAAALRQNRPVQPLAIARPGG
jgi:1-acyl-sn-glycerol-3-phosphate acyltransferase